MMANRNVLVASDPVAIVIKECINLSTAMKKYSKYAAQSGVGALLSSSGDLFNALEDEHSGVRSNNGKSNNDPLVAGFVQLRVILNKAESLADIDALTLLQPFLLVITTGSVSSYITSLSLDSLQKFLALNIVNEDSSNYILACRETVNALTHCKFNGGTGQQSDDGVLLKLVLLLNTIITSPCGDVLSDISMYEIIQIIMSLACNKRRTELLRKTAESVLFTITIKLFSRLKSIEPMDTTYKYINDEGYADNALIVDTLGQHEDNDTGESQQKKEEAKINHNNYGLPVLKQYLSLLMSLIVPENQAKHTNSTKILAIRLIDTAVELSGETFLSYPPLFSLISDPVFRSVVFLIQNTNKLSVLQAALQLFTTLVINLGEHLQMQIELTLTLVLNILTANTGNLKVGDNKIRPPAVLELLLEQISVLWTRSTSFFTSLFISFDCNLDRSDISINFLKALTKLSLPEVALTIGESIPNNCLEGLVSLVDDMFEHIDHIDRQLFMAQKDEIAILQQKERKTIFIKCAEAFNEKPKIGIKQLVDNKFISSDSDKEVAEFLFRNNGRLNKKTIGLLLCDPQRQELLRCFIELFDFNGLRVDEAIRILLTKFRLPGESQQIERIVEAFSTKYVNNQNYDPAKAADDIENDISTVQPDSDSVFVLSYSIIMLNTDLHNPQVKEHMSFDDYSGNLKGCCNGKDFPFWYLDKIYCSIRDKEIVMPEEHHGNERWFDDVWNNMISSATVMTGVAPQAISSKNEYAAMELAQFDRAIFKNIGPSILNTLFKVFVNVSDDHNAARMSASIDKCAYIAGFFNFKSLYNDILRNISKVSTLLPSEKSADQYDDLNMPVVEITIPEKNTKIPVSALTIRLGKSYKGQLCCIILFKLVKRNKSLKLINESLWSDIMKIIVTLFENLLIPSDIFLEFQQKLKLGPLPRPNPDVSVGNSKMNKGLLLSFASYIKGDEQPTDEEVETSIKALECIRNCDISSLLREDVNGTPELLNKIIGSIREEKTKENERFYEAEFLFLVETSVALFLHHSNEKELGERILDKLVKISKSKHVSKTAKCRLASYILLLISIVGNGQSILIKFIDDALLKDNETYSAAFFASEQGIELLNRLMALTTSEKYVDCVLKSEGFWKLLKKIARIPQLTPGILHYLESSLTRKKSILSQENFMLVLSLLDEISSIGAIGSKWEKEYERLVKSGHKVDKESPHKDMIAQSIRSIDLTAKLIENREVFYSITHSEQFAIIQVIAHQCQNPCNQLRLHALDVLEFSMTKSLHNQDLDIALIEGLIDGGLLPLLESSSNTASSIDLLSVISKVYLYYLKSGTATNDTYLKVLNIYNRFVENQAVEQQLQQLITDKKEIEKAAASSS